MNLERGGKPIQAEVCMGLEKDTEPHQSRVFSEDNKLHGREDHISRHCAGFQRAAISFLPTEPNLALVVKTSLGNVPSGMSPAASTSCCCCAARAAVFHLNVSKWKQKMQREWLWATLRQKLEVNNIKMVPANSGLVNWSKAIIVQNDLMVVAVLFRQGNCSTEWQT